MTDRNPVQPETQGETERLEMLWSGNFGNAYNERNAPEIRAPFWEGLLAKWPIRSVLEIGCGQGANLGPIAAILRPQDVWGVDVNAQAVRRARDLASGANVVQSAARELPFRDAWFDLVFTAGVLIHQPDESLPRVMAEAVRCSRRFVLWAEYGSKTQQELRYHEQDGALFKRNFGWLYRELAPDARVVDEGFLSIEEGWGDVDWQLLSLR